MQEMDGNSSILPITPGKFEQYGENKKLIKKYEKSVIENGGLIIEIYGHQIKHTSS